MLPLHETQLEPGSATRHVPSPYKGYGIGFDRKYLLGDTGRLRISPSFQRREKAWLEDYAFFCALRDAFGTDDWTTWPEGVRKRVPLELKKWRKRLSEAVEAEKTTQGLLDALFRHLKRYAGKRGIALIGDIPYYLSHHSPLVWRYQHLFDLDNRGGLAHVSGVLDGPKSHFGRQVWGHPLYLWRGKKNFEEIMDLWELRIRSLSSIYDWVRLDHAKGFFSYGKLGVSQSDDELLEGPGKPALESVLGACRRYGLRVFAEDTGEHSKPLKRILHRHRVPGIRILRFAYLEKEERVLKECADIGSYPVNVVAYSSTHDTITLLGFLERLSHSQRETLFRYMSLPRGQKPRETAISLRKALLRSKANMVLLPLQDWLLTTNRINIPGTEEEVGDPNWRYVMEKPIEKLPISLW